jgi:hypothetical protein
MNTVFPYEGQIDFGKYLDEYFQREDAYRSLPGEEELIELARKSIIREQLVLLPLPEGTKAEAGDTAVLKTESTLPKFNKERVTVTLGRGLYSRELEPLLIGKAVGETVQTEIGGEPVRATILELKRKQAPEPTDEMVVALEQKDHTGNPLTTVADYVNYVRETKINEILGHVNYYTMSKIIEDYPLESYDEDDIRVLGELERESFIQMFAEKEGIDLTKEVPKGWEDDMHVHSLDEFIAMRRDWYKMKIQQSLIFLNILGLKAEGRTDPCDHYEVMMELQLKIFDLIRTELERRNEK